MKESIEVASLDSPCVNAVVFSSQSVGSISQNASLSGEADPAISRSATCNTHCRRRISSVSVLVVDHSDCHRRWHWHGGILLLHSICAVIVIVDVNGKLLGQSRCMEVISVIRHGARACWQFPHILAGGCVDRVPRRH